MRYSVLSKDLRPLYTLLSVALHKSQSAKNRDVQSRGKEARMG